MTAAGAITTLYSFDYANGFGDPSSDGLIQGSDGSLVGTTVGKVFQLSGTGTLTVLSNSAPYGSTFIGPLVHGRNGDFYGVSGNSGVFQLANPSLCDDALTLSYTGGTLHLGFTLKTPTPASWSAWIGIQGSFYTLWSSVALPTIGPAVFFDLPIPGFPPVGQVFMLTTLTTGSGICLDWKTVNAQ
jgi:hypothetical protein